MLKVVPCFRFLTVTVFVFDVFNLNKLSLAFQKQNIGFSFEKCQTAITMKCLKDLLIKVKTIKFRVDVLEEI